MLLTVGDVMVLPCLYLIGHGIYLLRATLLSGWIWTAVVYDLSIDCTCCIISETA